MTARVAEFYYVNWYYLLNGLELFGIDAFFFAVEEAMMSIDAIIIGASDVMMAGVEAMMSLDGFKKPIDKFILLSKVL